MSRLTLALGLGLLVAEASAAVWLVARNAEGENAWLQIALPLTVGVAIVLSGLVALALRPQNRTGVYLLAVGYVWFLGALTDASNDWVFTIGYAFANLVWMPFTALVLAYPSGELRTRTERVLPVVAGALLVATQILVLLFDPTPAPDRCTDCGGSAIVIVDRPGLADAAQALATVVGLALITTVVTILVRRWRGATAALRRVLRPVFLTGATTLVSIGAVLVADQVAPDAARPLQVVFLLSFASIPIAFLLGVLRTRLARSPVNELVLALQAGTPIRDALAAGLGDPTVEVSYRLAGGARWVDATGRRVDDPAPTAGRAVAMVEVHGLPIAAIEHDASLEIAGDLVDSVTAAAGLAIQNERLQAEALSQFEFLRQMTDTAPSLIVNIDTSGRIRNQNRAAVAAAGVEDQESIRGRFFWDVYIDPAEREDVIARFEALAPNFEAGEYENAFTNARGERLVVSWRSAPVVDTDGTVMTIVAGGIDITERQRLEEDKERERAFLSAIANEAPSLLCLVDEHGVVADSASNRAFERTLEYEPHETGGELFWRRYVAPEDAADAARHILSVAAGDSLPATDSTWVTQGGRRLTVSWSCRRLPPVDDRRLLLVSGVDVTERRQRELDIQRERDATTTVLQAIPSVILVLDRAGLIRDRDTENPLAAVNMSFRSIFDWSDTDLVGKPFLELVVAEDPDGDAARAIATAAEGQVSEEVESVWRAHDGRLVPVSWTASPVVDVTGRTDGLVLVSGVDVSDRKQRELEDERRRQFIDAITATIPSYLVIVQPDATVREQGVNEAFEEAFGWPAAEIAGRSFVGCVTPESDFSARMLIANAANGVAQGEIESRWEARDGETRIVAWTARPVVAPQGDALVLITGNDVTVRRLQEEELRASRQRIVAAGDEARRRLERNLHDGAQQRLVALSVSLRLAESRLATDPEAARPILNAAREELAHALAELRELARGIHPAVLTDRGLVAAVDGLVGRSPVPVRTEVCQERLAPAIEAAAYYVISESLANVVKHAQAQVVDVHVVAENGVLTVTVSDDGVGGADGARGSGLRGLADRVSALDGSLSVESEPGAGTTVRAEIPVRPDGVET